MSKFYKVTARAADAAIETIVELPDDLPRKPESHFENTAQACAQEAILKRWQEINPDGQHLNLNFSIQLLLNNTGVPVSGLGPYRFEFGIKVWIVNAPLSWGAFGPRPSY
jgi:hypothetical protein